MIFTNRKTVKKPSILGSDRAKKAYEEMQFFYMEESQKSKYKRFEFERKIFAHPWVKDALLDLFHDKCAYCESKISTDSQGDVELFRPKAGSMNLDGSFDPNHYWWLAYEWENLYVICPSCNQNKRNYFPVRDNLRAPVLGDLSEETAFLIDPCKIEDFTEQHIDFIEGEAVPLSDRGEISIKTIGLNRNELIKSRTIAIKELGDTLRKLENNYNNPDPDLIANIDQQLQATSPYLSCKWANFTEELIQLNRGQAPEYLPFYRDIKLEIEGLEKAIPTIKKSVKKKASRKAYSLDNMTEKAQKTYFGESRWIQRVRIKNFKIIDELELEFSRTGSILSKEFKQPWLTFLGENGTGKSTVLQAIALTMAGEKRLNELDLNAVKFVNRNNDDGYGWVKVYLSDRKSPITLEFSKSTPDFKITPKAPQLIVRAYGATRLFSKGDDDPIEKDYLFIKNLFDEQVLLLNGNKWLREKISDEKLFQEIAKSLGDLLSLEEEQYFYPDEDEDGNPIVSLKLYPNKKGIPLDDLSAGYKAILALGLDIMMGFGQIWPSIFNAQGLVLVDEIGVHLHPRWKMRIVSTLRNTFPGINFIIATHEPLCLRGLEDGEVILLRLDGNKDIEVIKDLPSPKTMRVGQLLTSVFGLHTTLDPEVEKLLSEFYQLMSIRKRTDDQEIRLETLRDLLKDDLKENPITGRQQFELMLGDEVKEMLGYNIIEQKVADFKSGKSKPLLTDLKKDTLAEVQKLWKKKR